MGMERRALKKHLGFARCTSVGAFDVRTLHLFNPTLEQRIGQSTDAFRRTLANDSLAVHVLRGQLPMFSVWCARQVRTYRVNLQLTIPGLGNQFFLN